MGLSGVVGEGAEGVVVVTLLCGLGAPVEMVLMGMVVHCCCEFGDHDVEDAGATVLSLIFPLLDFNFFGDDLDDDGDVAMTWFCLWVCSII